MTALASEPTITSTDDADGPVHAVCCIEDVAICGKDVKGDPWVSDDEELTCVVCIDLSTQRCPRCGQ
jgi:hypothetical protein